MSPPLRIGDLPAPAADWHEISEFALTFNGWRHADRHRPGRPAALFEIAADVRAALAGDGGDAAEFTLGDLRAALLLEQRVARWSKAGATAEVLDYCHRLIDCMRRRLAGDEEDG